MACQTTTVHLSPELFGDNEKTLLDCGPLSASVFKYSTGVAALRFQNEFGEAVLLPFQGQQVWSATFHGRNLTMRSMFSEPQATRDYLATYGAFFIHCGATAMGNPGEKDRHPLHGELPNAPFQKAWIVCGADDDGDYLGLGGAYEHTMAFGPHYVCEPLLKFYADSSVMRRSVTLRNLKHVPMEWMYLAHINFNPVENSRLVYTARCTPEHVRVRKTIPTHIAVSPKYRRCLEEFAVHPEKHNDLTADLFFDPEVCFFIDYEADKKGWAHTLQIHPDGTADYVRHHPSQLDKAVRWICRVADQAAIGIVLPATAEPDGYHAEKAKGNIKVIPPLGEVTFDYDMGMLSAPDAARLAKKIVAKYH